MLANILGINYTNGTLSFPSYLGIAAITLIGVSLFIVFTVKLWKHREFRMKSIDEANNNYWRSVQKRKAEERAEEKQIQQLEKQELEQLLPQPWLHAYQDCDKLDSKMLKHAWFKEWINRNQTKGSAVKNDLPQLSIEAISKIAKMASYSENEQKFMLGRLSPYMIQNEPNTSTPPRDWASIAANEKMRPEIKTMKRFFDVVNELGISDPDVIKQMNNLITYVGMNTYRHAPGCQSADCHCLQEQAIHIMRQMKGELMGQMKEELND